MRNYLACVAVLVVAIPLPGLLLHDARTPLQRPLSSLSYDLGPWRGRDEPIPEAVRQRLGTEDLVLREYVDAGGDAVGLYVSYFARQRQNESSHSPRHCLPGAGWRPLSESVVPYPLPAEGHPQMNEILYGRDERQQLVFYWFRERDHILASEYWVKWQLLWDAITRGRTDGALVRISTRVAGSEQAARERALLFMQVALPQLDDIFPR